MEETHTKKIWIRLPSTTAIIAGPNFRPGTWDRDLMMYTNGCYDQISIPAGEPFEIEEQEGLRLCEKHNGEILRPGEPEEELVKNQPLANRLISEVATEQDEVSSMKRSGE